MSLTRACGLVVGFLIALAPLAAATQHSQNQAGEDNEFGSIRVPYQLEMSGEPIVVEATVVLATMYEDQKATFFMFAADTQNAPTLAATILSLQAGGVDLVVTEKQKDPGLEKWFVDVGDMPPAGTPIVLRSEVSASSKGFFSVGSMVVPFNYRWAEVHMSDGVQAKLYGYSQIGVNRESGGPAESTSRFGAPGGGKLPVPGVEWTLAVAAVSAVAFLAGRRR